MNLIKSLGIGDDKMKELFTILIVLSSFSNVYASNEDECLYLAVNEAWFINEDICDVIVPFYIGYVCIDNDEKNIELYIKSNVSRVNNGIENNIASINKLPITGRVHVGAYKKKYEGREEVRPFNYVYATAPKNSEHFPEYVADSLFNDKIYPFRKELRKDIDPDWIPTFTVQKKIQKGSWERTANFSYTN